MKRQYDDRNSVESLGLRRGQRRKLQRRVWELDEVVRVGGNHLRSRAWQDHRHAARAKFHLQPYRVGRDLIPFHRGITQLTVEDGGDSLTREGAFEKLDLGKVSRNGEDAGAPQDGRGRVVSQMRLHEGCDRRKSRRRPSLPPTPR